MIFSTGCAHFLSDDRFDTQNRPAQKIRAACVPSDIISRRVREMTDEIECTYLYQRAEFLENLQRP